MRFPLKMAVAKAMLEEVHTDLPNNKSNNNAYILGKTGAHNVVASCLPAGVYGTISAAAVATHLLARFQVNTIWFTGGHRRGCT